MRHRKTTVKLNRPPAHKDAMLRNLAESVILHEKVRTTEAKAKAVRAVVERAITTGKKPTLASRRKLLSAFSTEYPVKKILDVLSLRYATRPGGYTRIVKLQTRQGDGAQMVRIELV